MWIMFVWKQVTNRGGVVICMFLLCSRGLWLPTCAYTLFVGPLDFMRFPLGNVGVERFRLGFLYVVFHVFPGRVGNLPAWKGIKIL